MSNYTAGIFIINQKKEILLTHATNSSKKSWGIPKGLAEDGEDNTSAAIREVEEETGIKFNNKAKIHHLGNMKYKTGNKTLAAYYCFLDDCDDDDVQLITKTGEILKGKNLEISKMTCRSMVIPDDTDKKPFPEVDSYKWFSISDAEQVIYQPQKALLYILNIVLGVTPQSRKIQP